MLKGIPAGATRKQICASVVLLGFCGFSVAAKPNADMRVMRTTNMSCNSLARIALNEIGVSPATLAAVGADAGQTTTIVAAVRSACETQADGFDAAQALYEESLRTIRSLEPKVVDGSITDDERVMLTTARESLAIAQSERETSFAQIRSTISNTLDAEQHALLESILMGKTIEAPVKYKAVYRNASEWQQVTSELTTESTGVEVQGVADVPEVEVVEILMETSIEEVTTAWNLALID